ncbi:response regulator [Cohnella sp. GCM10020058]|uniref:response regulator n=1 Tax=Cohnella sp. GCM10020058 TaxID=3317330 RepID=UPI0036372473
MWNAIIADDERKARNVVRNLGNWHELGIRIVAEATDGDELLELAQEWNPDLVISDMRMPGIQGAELIRALRRTLPEAQIAIVSGFEDFEYLREALQSHAVDYMLKPLEEESFHLALAKAVRELASLRDQRLREISIQVMANESRTRAREQTFYKWLSASPLKTDETKLLHDWLAATDGNVPLYRIMVISFLRYSRLLARYNGDASLMKYAIANMLEEIGSPGRTRAFGSPFGENEFILVFPDAPSLDKIDSFWAESNEQLQRLLGAEAWAGVSGICRSIDEAASSLAEGRAAMMQQTLSEAKSRAQEWQQASQLQVVHAFAFNPHLPNRLRAAIEIGNGADLARIIDGAWLEAKMKDDLTLLAVRQFARMLIRELQTVADKTADLPAMQTEWLSLVQTCEREYDPADMMPAFKLFCEHIQELQLMRPAFRDKNALFGIKKFVEENYMIKLSLADLANRFFMSEEHISRMFKEEFEVNLFDYIAGLKIDKAKALLVKERVKVQEIVEMLNFTDASHFTKVFKKYTGTTPKAFRNGRYGALDDERSNQ